MSSGDSISACASARIPVERTESNNARTSGRNMTAALKGCARTMLGLQSLQRASIAPDHPVGNAMADPDASRSCPERDIGAPVRHGLHDPCSWFGSAGLPRVAFVAWLPGHSLRCGKFGRDRSSNRSTPAHGTGHTERTGQPCHRIRASGDVSRACKNAASALPKARHSRASTLGPSAEATSAPRPA
jgi:hypothetical protein